MGARAASDRLLPRSLIVWGSLLSPMAAAVDGVAVEGVASNSAVVNVAMDIVDLNVSQCIERPIVVLR